MCYSKIVYPEPWGIGVMGWKAGWLFMRLLFSIARRKQAEQGHPGGQTDPLFMPGNQRREAPGPSNNQLLGALTEGHLEAGW